MLVPVESENVDLTTLPSGSFLACHLPLHRGGYSEETPSVCFADTVSRGRARAAPLPTHLLRSCAGALKRRAQCAVSELANGQSPTGALPRKHLLALLEGGKRGGEGCPAPAREAGEIYSLSLIIGVRRMMRQLPQEGAYSKVNYSFRQPCGLPPPSKRGARI